MGTRTGRRGWVAAVAALGVALPLAFGAPPAQARPTAPALAYDLDGDGRPELVVGAPGLEVSGHAAAGGVVVVRQTTRAKPRPADARLVTQSTSGVAGASERGDRFGSAVASGDFDADGYADLAVGLPDEDFSGRPDAGAVTILYGSRKGVTGRRSVQVSEPSGKHTRALFGSSVVVGDLDGDRYADLAVGAPGDDSSAGTVTVLHGGPKGLQPGSGTLLRGVRGTAEPDTAFGTNLAVADADADGRPDLVVLSGGRDSSEDEGPAGSLSSCAAGRTGTPTGCRRLVRSDDLRGDRALVVGDVAGDARPEIVAGGGGDPEFDPGHVDVATLSGSGTSTAAAVRQLRARDLGVESGGAFGDALALGDLGGDAHADLAIGAWAQDEGDDPVGGRVFVVRGGADGLATTGNLTLDQDAPGVPGSSEPGDDFGYALAVVDRNLDGRPDLVIGSPGEDGTGRVTTLRGTAAGPTTRGAGAFGSADLRLRKGSEAGFGAVLGG